MAAPREPVTLSPEQIEQLRTRLADFRHSVNNHLSMMVAAIELIRRKPESAARLVESIARPQEKIVQEMEVFSAELERMLGITPEPEP